MLFSKSTIALTALLLTAAIPTTLVYGQQGNNLATPIATAILGQNSPTYQFTIGQQWTYKLDYRNTSTSDLRALFRDLKDADQANAPSSFVNAFENHVQADLTMTIVESQPANFLIAYRFQTPTVTINASGQTIKEQAQLVQTELNQTIFATVDRQGRILNLRFAANTSQITQSFARTVLATVQFVTPQTANSTANSTWETPESDPNGDYIARYEMKLGHNLKNLVQKTKLRYLQPQQNQRSTQNKVTPIITSTGQLTAEFDRQQGRLTKLTGQEIQQFEVSKKAVGESKTDLNLSFSAQAKLATTALTQLQQDAKHRFQQSPAIALGQGLSEQASITKIHRQQLGEDTLETLLKALDQVEQSAAPAATTDQTTLYLKFKALIYLQPKTSETLAQRLIDAKAESPTMQLLVGSLSAIGHADAQAALTQTLQTHNNDPKTLLLILPSLAAVEQPTTSTVQTLEKLSVEATDPRVLTTAQLSLGTIAHRLSETAPDRANAIVDRFTQALQNAKSDEAIKQNLLVLGNAGSVRSLTAIRPHLTSPQSDIRTIALVSLRWIPGQPVDDLLNESLQRDTDEMVRAETAAALSFREMTVVNFAIQKQAITTDPSPKVRLALLNNLWQVREQMPEVKSIVQQIAQTDPAEELRQTATNLLAE